MQEYNTHDDIKQQGHHSVHLLNKVKRISQNTYFSNANTQVKEHVESSI